MKLSNFILYEDLEKYILIQRILIHNLKDFNIPIYNLTNNKGCISRTSLKSTEKFVLLDNIEKVKIRIPSGLINNISKKDIKKYNVKINLCEFDKSLCTTERTELEMSFLDFTQLVINFKNTKEDIPNYYKIESIFHYTLSLDSIELIENTGISKCYVLQCN